MLDYNLLPASIVGIMTVAIQIFSSRQIGIEIEKLKSDINKDKIDRIIQIAGMSREYNKMQVILLNKFNSFLKSTKSKLKREEIDRYYFDVLLIKANEITLVNDSFYSNEIIKRNDFIESIIIPFLKLSLKYISYMNSIEILKSTKSDKTEITKIDILPIIRFIETTKNNKVFDKKLIEEAETFYKQILA